MNALPHLVRPHASVVVAAVTAAIVVAGIGYAVDASADREGTDALGPGVVTVPIGIDHSQFSTDRVTVKAGTLVRFVVENDDPIHHELVVGPDEVHRDHERGTELAHPPVPGEVSVGPNASGMTFFTFDDPGEVTFACHLPGHVDYGMVGTIEVVP